MDFIIFVVKLKTQRILIRVFQTFLSSVFPDQMSYVILQLLGFVGNKTVIEIFTTKISFHVFLILRMVFLKTIIYTKSRFYITHRTKITCFSSFFFAAHAAWFGWPFLLFYGRELLQIMKTSLLRGGWDIKVQLIFD